MKRQVDKVDSGSDVLRGIALQHEARVQKAVGKQIIAFSSNDHFLVPVEVTELRIFAVGASGGSGNGFGVLLNNGGEGGTAVSNVKVFSGESLEIFVGVCGQDGDLPNGGQGGDSASNFEGGTAASGKAGRGGGGGGLYGGGAGSELDVESSGGGAGGTGTLEGGLSSDGGGHENGVVLLSYNQASD